MSSSSIALVSILVRRETQGRIDDETVSFFHSFLSKAKDVLACQDIAQLGQHGLQASHNLTDSRSLASHYAGPVLLQVSVSAIVPSFAEPDIVASALDVNGHEELCIVVLIVVVRNVKLNNKRLHHGELGGIDLLHPGIQLWLFMVAIAWVLGLQWEAQ